MLFELLQQAAMRYPRRVALIHGSRRATYQELLDGAALVAGCLAERGVGKGDAVAVALPTGIACCEVMFAVSGLGAQLLPLAPRVDQKLILRLLRVNRVTGIIAEQRAADVYRRVIGSGRLSRRAGDSAPFVITPDELSASPEKTFRPAAVAADAVAARYPRVSRTGFIRHVPRTHAQLLGEGQLMAQSLGLSSDEVVFGGAPLQHGFGLGVTVGAWLSVQGTLLLGGTAADAGAAERDDTWRHIESERVSVMLMAPYVWQRLGRARSAPKVPRLRAAVVAASSAASADLQRWSRCTSVPVRLHYGTAETGPIATAPAMAAGTMPNGLGRPHEGVQLLVVDDGGAPLPAGTTGEIAVKGPLVIRGYEHQTLVNRRVFLNGYFLTGDTGHVDSAGYLFVTGRLRQELRFRGHWIDPLEIEAVLARHPRVRDCVVLRSSTGREEPTSLEVHIVTQGTCPVDELRQHCAQQLPFYLVPQAFHFVEELRTTAQGRVVRGAG